MLRTRVMAGPTAGVVLAIVLAAILTAIYSAELLSPRLRVRPNAPAPVTLRLPTVVYVPPAPTTPLVWRPQRVVVPRGAVPTGETAALVEAYEQFRRPLHTWLVLGLGAIYALAGLLLSTYMRYFGPSAGRLLRTHIGLFGLVVVLAGIAKAELLLTPFSEFYIPIAAVPLWSALYIDRRTALLFNMGLSFLVASFAGFDVTLLTVFLARGLVATVTFRDRKHPRTMLLAGLIGGLAGAAVLLAMRAYFTGGFDALADLRAGAHGAIFACVAGGVLSGALAWVLQEPAGMALGAVSRGRLMDLSDLDHPLLKKMAAEAPGSWQHARAMANLAEGAAAAIGADALLTRVGAYYHDLGKTIQPQYFVENLAAGERSPHEDLDPDVSADVIMSHVVAGTKILREAHIPEAVVEFAYTHHGTSIIEFFWHKCLQQGNPKGLTEAAFRYPGMKPQTRETAILMLIDSIEAASRTIDPPEREKFEEMIQRVIFTKMKQGQLEESGLTIEDLRVLITSIAETLVKVYHHRIKYPWQKPGAPAPVPSEPSSPVPPSPEEKPGNGAGVRERPRQESLPPEGPRASEPPPPPEGEERR
jgi:hypothetical protein